MRTLIRENFWDDILAAAKGEPIEAVVIGGGLYDDDPRSLSDKRLGLVFDAETAKTLLNYRYDSGFGGADCHRIYAYTANRVLLVSEYDGSTRVMSVPRNPITGIVPVYA